MARPPKNPSFGNGFASVHPGFEDVLLAELKAMGVDAKLTEGGVSFPASLSNLHEVHLRSRIAGRVLVRLGTVKAPTLEQFAQSSRLQPWSRYIHPSQDVRVDVVTHAATLKRKDAVSKKLVHAIADSLRGPRLYAGRPPREPARVLVRIVGERATLNMDASGELLHRRGWRLATATAPLRENLAAGVLELAGWAPTEPLVDPMCGSGTFGIEAARHALGLLPGANRTFAFHAWPGVDAKKLPTPQPAGRAPFILLADRAERALQSAMANAKRAGVAERIQFRHVPLEELQPPEGITGLVVFNPPWGDRVADRAPLDALYTRWGRTLREDWPGWRVAIVVPAGPSLNRFGFSMRVAARFVSGGKPVVVAVSEVPR